jgi:hypothetical protein
MSKEEKEDFEQQVEEFEGPDHREIRGPRSFPTSQASLAHSTRPAMSVPRSFLVGPAIRYDLLQWPRGITKRTRQSQRRLRRRALRRHSWEGV